MNNEMGNWNINENKEILIHHFNTLPESKFHDKKTESNA